MEGSMPDENLILKLNQSKFLAWDVYESKTKWFNYLTVIGIISAGVTAASSAAVIAGMFGESRLPFITSIAGLIGFLSSGALTQFGVKSVATEAAQAAGEVERITLLYEHDQLDKPKTVAALAETFSRYSKIFGGGLGGVP
jgi:hypothetical protein